MDHKGLGGDMEPNIWDKICIYTKTAYLIAVYGIDGAREKSKEELTQARLESAKLIRELNKMRRQR